MHLLLRHQMRLWETMLVRGRISDCKGTGMEWMLICIIPGSVARKIYPMNECSLIEYERSSAGSPRRCRSLDLIGIIVSDRPVIKGSRWTSRQLTSLPGSEYATHADRSDASATSAHPMTSCSCSSDPAVIDTHMP